MIKFTGMMPPTTNWPIREPLRRKPLWREALGRMEVGLRIQGSLGSRSASDSDVGPPLTGSLRSQEDLVSVPSQEGSQHSPTALQMSNQPWTEN